MSLTTNNTSLQSILDTVNALPDAGSGSVETCNIQIECTGLDTIWYTDYVDGETLFNIENGLSFSLTISNVVCNSCLLIKRSSSSSTGYSIECSDGISLVHGGEAYDDFFAFSTPAQNVDATIYITDNDDGGGLD